MSMTMRRTVPRSTVVAAATVLAAAISTLPARALDAKWCKDVHIRFFVGGAEGDAFGTIVYNGAKQAETDLGPKVDYIFSQWDIEKMVQQLREAIAVKPNGIAMMGHPGDASIMPLAEQAHKDGIKMMYQNVPVPKVTAAFGGGYVGAQQEQQGRALGAEAFKLGKLKAGDKAIMIGPSRMRPAARASAARWQRSRKPASRSSSCPHRRAANGRPIPIWPFR
ncbi:substrate-binding domain-containing protein [Mesorhizobium sp. M1066]